MTSWDSCDKKNINHGGFGLVDNSTYEQSVSRYRGTYPQNGLCMVENANWMIQGYSHFRKPLNPWNKAYLHSNVIYDWVQPVDDFVESAMTKDPLPIAVYWVLVNFNSLFCVAVNWNFWIQHLILQSVQSIVGLPEYRLNSEFLMLKYLKSAIYA